MMDDIHVRPTNDLIMHDTTGDDCVCGPTIRPVKTDSGAMAWMIVHNSLDGRELHEVP